MYRGSSGISPGMPAPPFTALATRLGYSTLGVVGQAGDIR
jgi:hypothetical protein